MGPLYRLQQCVFLVADTPTPPVDVTDLRRYGELLETLAAELDASTDGDEKLKGSIAAFALQKVVEGVCGSGANAQALWLRNGLLEMFLREGYLAPLRSCTELDDAVLQLAATIPFDGQDLKPQFCPVKDGSSVASGDSTRNPAAKAAASQ